MKVLYSWLREYFKAEVDIEYLAERLNFAGISVENLEKIKPTFKGVITAKILKIRPHPNADKLSLVLIDYGKGTIEVVCGARNIREGQIVPFAPVGSTLKNGEFVLEPKKIRGVVSQGMLCSETELDLGEDSEGIFILSDELGENIPLGKPVEEVLGIADDYLLEFELPSNRPDCFSVIGIAREAHAVAGGEFRLPEFSCQEDGPEVSSIVKVEIEDEELCPRYSAKAVVEVENRRSPFWMRWRLLQSGLRPISAIVDVTNYVMLETGQPLHAFDKRFISDSTIIVRPALEDEEITTLDGIKRKLRKGMLVIADSKKPVAIAGIMGAENSEVLPDTRDVIIESAHFNPKSIMRTSRLLKLSTEASLRFEKGVDPEGTVFAAQRAAYLIQKICGGKIAKGEVDVYLKRYPEKEIKLRHARLEKVVGWHFTEEDVLKVFNALGFKAEKREDNYFLKVPSFRVDIEREIDAIEEVARIFGYDRIPSRVPAVRTQGRYEEGLQKLNLLREMAIKAGFTEAISNPLLPLKTADIFKFSNEAKENLVNIVNPLSNDLALLSPFLSINLVYITRNNYTRGIKNLRVFEIGKAFKKTNDVLPEEKVRFSAAVCGFAIEKKWWGGAIQNNFFDLKGLLEFVLEDEGAVDLVEMSDKSPDYDGFNLDFLDPSESAFIEISGQKAGFAGRVSDEVLSALDIDVPVYVLEVEVGEIEKFLLKEKRYQPIPQFPAIVYDFSFLIDESVKFGQIKEAITALNLKYLEKIEVFDVYRGKGIEKGKKSMAIRLTFRSNERTLEESEVRGSFEKAMQTVKDGFGAEIRGAGRV